METFKVLFVLLLSFMAFNCDSCSGIAYPPDNAKLVFDSNPDEENVVYYVIYRWQGPDTLGFSVSLMDSLGMVNHINDVDTVVFKPFVVSDEWVTSGAIAVKFVQDTIKLESQMGLIQFYHYSDIFGPSTPGGGKLKKQ